MSQDMTVNDTLDATNAPAGTLAKSSMTDTSPSMEAAKDIAFGSIAGGIGKILEYPFDTVKVRLQSQSLTNPRYTGPLDCFRQSIRADGIVAGLYRGVSAPILGAAIETSSLFFSYRVAQEVMAGTFYRGYVQHNDRQHLKASLPFSALVWCGAMSGAFTSILLTPIELVKCQMQVPALETASYSRRPGVIQLIRTVFSQHGLLGLWRGQLGTLIRETGGSAAWFGSYEGMSGLFRSYNNRSLAPEAETALPISQQLLAGATAGVTYNFAFFPADTIKSRMQTEDVRTSQGGASPAPSTRHSFWSTAQALWQKEGLRGMYRGCGITVARAAPSSAFIFAIYEGLREWWD